MLESEVIATWGRAKLTKTLTNSGGKEYKLVGGSEKDRAEAREWIRRFMPEERVEEVGPFAA